MKKYLIIWFIVILSVQSCAPPKFPVITKFCFEKVVYLKIDDRVGKGYTVSFNEDGTINTCESLEYLEM